MAKVYGQFMTDQASDCHWNGTQIERERDDKNAGQGKMKMFKWNCLKCVAISIFNDHLIKRFINGSRARLSRLSENEVLCNRYRYRYRVMQSAVGERRKRLQKLSRKKRKKTQRVFRNISPKKTIQLKNVTMQRCWWASLSVCVCVSVGWLLDVASLGDWGIGQHTVDATPS